MKQIATWSKNRFFSSPLHALITLISLYILWLVIPPLVEWSLVKATWVGESSADCHPDGACWAFIIDRFPQFIYGFYPQAERWRVDVSFIVTAGLIIPLGFRKFPYKKAFGVLGLVVAPIFSWYFMKGGVFGLEEVETALWGGVLLTVVVSAFGIVASLPLGILLALGRRSSLPIFKITSTLFIEFWRGVPLITVLFMSSVLLPLFLPADTNIDKLLRALVGVGLFSAAYMAEVIRGGLQAIPKGQSEAASALGLGYWQNISFVVMPQAVQLVIPGIVNNFIGLFKDTTLVSIIGMFDLLGIVHAASSDPVWLGKSTEAYVFAGLFYWICCFGMSRYSLSLERKESR